MAPAPRAEVRLEPDGVVRITVEGSLTGEAAAALLEELQRQVEAVGEPLLVLADCRRSGRHHMKAQWVLLSRFVTLPPYQLALLGCRGWNRLLARLAAHNSLGRGLRCFEDEAEARAWLRTHAPAPRTKG